MKHLVFSFVALCASMFAMAQSNFYVYKTDGSAVAYAVADVDSISFTKPDTQYAVALGTFENGSVSADKETATEGEPVTLTIEPKAGFELDKLTVEYAEGQSITPTLVAENKYTFTMPASAVTVNATFKALPDTKEYVDLGLPSGLLWATCNVGAYAPQNNGNYYAWGETETKTNYSWDTYKYGSADNALTKYCSSSDYGEDGFTDDLTTLEASDDVAAKNWGDNWRMPTDAEWTELREKCTWTWTSNYNGTGVAGYEVKSKTNDNSIFLPAAGYRCSDGLGGAGSYGCYWSSSLRTDGPGDAWYVGFDSGLVDRYYDYRCCGQSVRPVVAP